MRIGIISPYSLTQPGGVQGQVLDLARVLRSRGHGVRVLGPCDGPPPDAGVTPLGASLPTTANGSVAPLAPDVSAQLRTIRALRDEAFDVVHLHEPFAPGPTQTAMLFKTAPLVGTFHAAGNALAYRWFGPVVRRAARRLDVRCAVSTEARDAAAATLGGTFELVFNGVDTTEFAAAEPWPVAGHGDAPSDGPVVLFLGRHEQRKGLGVLLEAFELVTALGGSAGESGGTGHDLRLWVAGEGPETEALRARHPDPAIEWLGRISDTEKRSRLRSASVFCAPSLGGESFGIVLLEAMAAGAPVLASDIPGYARVARDGTDALLVPPGDPAALAAGLTTLLGDAAMARRLVASGTQRAEEFSMERLAQIYEDAYQRAIAGCPTP